MNNSNLNGNIFNLTPQCNSNSENLVLSDTNQNDSIQYNQYHNLQHYNAANNQMQSMNNYSTQYQYQQSNNVVNSSPSTYGNYLMMQSNL